jgi:hypothetical protein
MNPFTLSVNSFSLNLKFLSRKCEKWHSRLSGLPRQAVQDDEEGRDDHARAELGADDAPGVGQLLRGYVPEPSPDVGAQGVAQAEGGDEERRLLVGEANELQPHGEERHRLGTGI